MNENIAVRKKNCLLLDNEVGYIMCYVPCTHLSQAKMRIANANNDNTKHQTRTIFLCFIDKLFVGAFQLPSIFFFLLSFSPSRAFLFWDIDFVVPPEKIVIILLPLLWYNFDTPTILCSGQCQSKCGKWWWWFSFAFPFLDVGNTSICVCICYSKL